MGLEPMPTPARDILWHKGSGGRGCGGTLQKPNSRAMFQDLGQRSKMEVAPKMACRRGSDARQSKRRRVRFCRGCLQVLQEEFSFRFILHR